MIKKPSIEVITELQHNQDYIILNNIFATPTFRKIAKEGEQEKDSVVNEVYAPKIFFEILSQLTPQHLIDSDGEYVTINFKIGDFIESIGSMNSNNDYNYIIEYVKKMQDISVNFEDAKFKMGFPIITYYKYEKNSGMMRIDVRFELAQAILAVKESENFSFLKKYILKLKSAQAIKFFPFLVSWRNKGMVQMNLEIFRKKFGYNTDGYKLFVNIKIKILDPVIKEINDKTDLIVSYKPLGKNLEGARQRVTGLQFFIKEKGKQQQLPQATAENTTFEEVKTTPIQPKTTTVKAPKSIVSQVENPYFADILRVFKVFEPDSTSENIIDFLGVFDNPKAVLEACLYAEQEQLKGHPIKNFRGYLVAGIPKGLGFGILEQRAKDQAKAQQIEQKKTAQIDKAAELENLLKEAEILRGGYKDDINAIMRKTATDDDKENVAKIMRAKNPNFAGKTIDEFRDIKYVSTYISTFIETYSTRFAEVQTKYQKAFDSLAAKIKKLDPDKAKNLFHY